jgi:hypothetical protein
MKKLAAILITVLMLAGLTTPVFAFGTRSNQRDYARISHFDQRGYERGRPVYQKTYNHYTPSRNPGMVVSLPLVPLPGVSHMFPSISIRLR